MSTQYIEKILHRMYIVRLHRLHSLFWARGGAVVFCESNADGSSRRVTMPPRGAAANAGRSSLKGSKNADVIQNLQKQETRTENEFYQGLSRQLTGNS